nr:MAG TPA: hypothetical protein [Caudoviricetes sp.]
MDAVRFIEERRRMYRVTGKYPPTLADRIPPPAEQIVKEVEEWSAAHPIKTRQSVFLKQWPNAKVYVDGVLDFCPQELDTHHLCKSTDIVMRCQSCRREFWMQEVE